MPYLDLRVNRDEASDAGFWPSFTDIMTVIVMIFMLAAVIMMVRNIELVQKLRATMEAERLAAQIAATTVKQKQALRTRVDEAENELSRLRMRLLLVSEERDKTKSKLLSSARRLSEVQEKQAALDTRIQTLAAQEERLAAQLAAETHKRTELEKRREALLASQKTTQTELARTRSMLETWEASAGTAQERAEAADRALAAARGEYSELKVKYDRLVRPARTTAGKHVVEVRFSKRGGRFSFLFKDKEDVDYRPTSREALNTLLARLKKRYPASLYVKIIIPEDSGLSYNEAWTFTNTLLGSYDYYYQ